MVGGFVGRPLLVYQHGVLAIHFMPWTREDGRVRRHSVHALVVENDNSPCGQIPVASPPGQGTAVGQLPWFTSQFQLYPQ